MSRATLRSQLDRLKSSGIILGFTVALKEDRFQLPIRATMLLHADLAAFDTVLGRIRMVEGVSATETNLLLATRKRTSTASQTDR